MGLTTEPVVFLYTIIFTINSAILPQLILHKVCMQHTVMNSTMCEDGTLKKFPELEDKVQKEASKWWFIILCVTLGLSVFSVLIWGPVTDIIGRKRAILFVPVCSGLQALCYLLNSYYFDASPAYLLFGAALSPLYGEFQGLVAVCYSYMADCTVGSLEQRTARMGFVEASIFYAGIPGGLLSGYLLKELGYVSCFVAILIINVIMFGYAGFFLPETQQRNHEDLISSKSSLLRSTDSENVPNENNSDVNFHEQNLASHDLPDSSSRKRSLSLLNPIRQLKQVFAVVFDPAYRRVVLPLIIAFGFSICAVNGELMVSVLYLKNRPFSMSEEGVGYYLALLGLVRGTGVIVVTQLAYRFLNLSDCTLIYMGLLSQALNYFLVGISRSVVVVFAVSSVGLAIPAATSALRSIITKQVSPASYGSVLASVEAVDAIAALITNCLSLWSYSLTLALYSGSVFYGLSAFSVVSLCIVLISHCLLQR